MSTERRHPNVVHADELEPTVIERGKHRFRRRSFGAAAGNRQLGGSLMELPAGAIAYPFHYHCANEEAIYVIAGTGTIRLGDQRVAVSAGDWIAMPIGPAHAHQMINDSDAPLVYLTVGTEHKCEVIGYPDSKKVTAIAGESWEAPWHREIKPAGETLDYWDGEPNA